MTADKAWLTLLASLMASSKFASPRGLETREILCFTSTVDMAFPVVTVPDRKLGYKFLAAEAHWILSGDNRVSSIAPYSSAIARFSDDGMRFNGAYGPRVVDQLTYVVDCLVADSDTRQAVMEIWRPNPRPSKDIPCTVCVQWLLRNGRLHCLDTMRSSDAWLGWPYDVFNFTMLTGLILLMMRERGKLAVLGDLMLTAGSQHLYSTNWKQAAGILKHPRLGFHYYPFDPHSFLGPQHLIDHLGQLVERGQEKLNITNSWLSEAFQKHEK